MAAKRMNREEFFRALSGFDEERLQKAPWNLYWRGTANVRERIEAELASTGRGRPPRPVQPPLDPELVHDVACEAGGYDYFRSEAAMAAAGFVVSDAAAVLWTSIRERHGFQRFAETAAPQLLRWESQSGWTRIGEGPVAAKETSLAVVLAGMLRVPDNWERFAEQYLRALDNLAAGKISLLRTHSLFSGAWERRAALAEWRRLLRDNLADTDGGLLDKIVGHRALRAAAAD